jgi:hypothetical protein
MILRAATLNALGDMPEAEAFQAARAIVGFFNGIEFGIEYLSLPTGNEVPYVNAGDTYDETLLRVGGEWVWACWGDVYEAAEQESVESLASLVGSC